MGTVPERGTGFLCLGTPGMYGRKGSKGGCCSGASSQTVLSKGKPRPMVNLPWGNLCCSLLGEASGGEMQPAGGLCFQQYIRPGSSEMVCGNDSLYSEALPRAERLEAAESGFGQM